MDEDREKESLVSGGTNRTLRSIKSSGREYESAVDGEYESYQNSEPSKSRSSPDNGSKVKIKLHGSRTFTNPVNLSGSGQVLNAVKKRKLSTGSIASVGYGSFKRNVPTKASKAVEKEMSRSKSVGSLKNREHDLESSSDDSEVDSRFWGALTKKEWVLIVMLSLANLCSTMAFSCIAPFYPTEAKDKGMDAFETGLVFGVFELVVFITAPLLGKNVIFY
uniref:MFS domain-containing protein n=1 Tax=Rhabditophanes sp. KR3021 TaxID=114890 RepID=A0AC35TJP9_9BILA